MQINNNIYVVVLCLYVHNFDSLQYRNIKCINTLLICANSIPHLKWEKGYTRGVTKPQFERLLHFLSLKLPPNDLKLIEKKFENPIGEFCNVYVIYVFE